MDDLRNATEHGGKTMGKKILLLLMGWDMQSARWRQELIQILLARLIPHFVFEVQ